MLTQDEREKYRWSGEIAKELKKRLQEAVKPKKTFLELAKIAEVFREENGHQIRPAFPLNISLNEIAAHYSPLSQDPSLLPAKGVVKLDLGIQIDGYITDTAITIDLDGQNGTLVNASKHALNAAIEVVKDGGTVKDISRAIETTIEEVNLRPIYNLSGHKITRYKLHSGVSIPNSVKEFGFLTKNAKLHEDDIYAIEPFATDGRGYVVDGTHTCIFRFGETTSELPMAKLLEEHFDHLPFSPRWLGPLLPSQPKTLLRQLEALTKARIVTGYPVLIEKSRAWVSQFEHTIRVTRNGCEVLT